MQSVALRMVVEREREIENFVKTEYWTVAANLSAKLPPAFDARLLKVGEQTVKTSNFDQEFTSVTPVLTPVQSGEPLLAGIDVWCGPLTYPGSSFTSNAGGIQRILIFGRLCLKVDHLGQRDRFHADVGEARRSSHFLLYYVLSVRGND